MYLDTISAICVLSFRIISYRKYKQREYTLWYKQEAMHMGAHCDENLLEVFILSAVSANNDKMR